MSEPLLDALAAYYRKIREVGGTLLLEENLYRTEALYLHARGWLAVEKLSPPPDSTGPPIYRATLTRLGAREGELALKARDGD